MVRCWCQTYQANLDFETDYQLEFVHQVV
jgi:hypothetical protein